MLGLFYKNRLKLKKDSLNADLYHDYLSTLVSHGKSTTFLRASGAQGPLPTDPVTGRKAGSEMHSQQWLQARV